MPSTEICIEASKQWIEENDAFFLALDEQIIFWGIQPDGTTGWVKYSLSQLVRLIKATKLSMSLMSEMSTDVVRVAFQECERVYISAVDTTQPIDDTKYFNLRRYAKQSLTTHERICLYLLKLIEKEEFGIKWSALSAMLSECYQVMGIDNPVAYWKNKTIVNMLVHTRFEERRYELRVWEKTNTGKMNLHNAIRLCDNKKSMNFHLTKQEMDRFVYKTVKNALNEPLDKLLV